MRRRSVAGVRGRRGAVALAVAAALSLILSGACSRTESGSNRGTVVGTAPPLDNPGGTIAGVPSAPSVDSLAGVSIKVEKVADVFEPVALTARSGTTTLYVAQKDGRVKQIAVDNQLDRDGNVRRVTYRVDPASILDISRSTTDEGERGLLGLAFSTDGRRLYVYYTDRQGDINVDEYKMNDDRVDSRSRRQVFFLKHPLPNHNGGGIAFGPDGFLYLGIGDGGGQGDPDRNGQNTKVLYAKLLRIDPEGATKDVAYGIPDGNPFKSGEQGAPEIWAYGLRNPWRFSWDRATGDLWIGDVGQWKREEIDLLPASPGGAGRGANLGWSLMEGSIPFEGGSPPAGYTPPIFDYGRDNGECSVTGGYVYRGKTIWTLAGVYVYADYCNGEIRGLLRKADNTIEERGFDLRVPAGNLLSGGSITSFGEDSDGELYVLSAAGGIYKIVAG